MMNNEHRLYYNNNSFSTSSSLQDLDEPASSSSSSSNRSSMTHPLLPSSKKQQQTGCGGEVYYDPNTYMFRYREPSTGSSSSIISASAPSSPGSSSSSSSSCYKQQLQQHKSRQYQKSTSSRRQKVRNSFPTMTGAFAYMSSSSSGSSSSSPPKVPCSFEDEEGNDVEECIQRNPSSRMNSSSSSSVVPPPSYAFHSCFQKPSLSPPTSTTTYAYASSSSSMGCYPSHQRMENNSCTSHRHSRICHSSSNNSTTTALGNTCGPGRVKTMFIMSIISAIGAFFTITVCIQHAAVVQTTTPSSTSSSNTVISGSTISNNANNALFIQQESQQTFPSSSKQTAMLLDNTVLASSNYITSADTNIPQPDAATTILSEEHNSFMKKQMMISSKTATEQQEQEQAESTVSEQPQKQMSGVKVDNSPEYLKEKHGTCYFPDLTKSHQIAQDIATTGRNTLSKPIINLGLPGMGTNTIYDFFHCINPTMRISDHMCQTNEGETKPCGTCMKHASQMNKSSNNNNNNILQQCGNYNVWTHLDTVSIETKSLTQQGNNECFFPQIELLEHIHKESPYATFLLPFVGDIDEWILQMKLNSNTNIYRQLIDCHIISDNNDIYFPHGYGIYDIHIREFICNYITRIRNFVQKYPTHTLIEFNLHADSTEQLLTALFVSQQQQQQEQHNQSRHCWNYNNSNNAQHYNIRDSYR